MKNNFQVINAHVTGDCILKQSQIHSEDVIHLNPLVTTKLVVTEHHWILADQSIIVNLNFVHLQVESQELLSTVYFDI